MAQNQQQSQNPYLVSGPFDVAIQPQTYQSTAPPTVSGYGGKTEGIAMLADRFLEGFSRGRSQQFQRTELERAKLQGDVDKARTRLDQAFKNGDITQEAYNKAAGQLDGLQIMQVKSEVDKSKDKDHPQLKMLKHAFDALVGPGGKKYEFGPQQVYQTLNQVYDTLHAPSSSGPEAVEKASNEFGQTLTQATQQLQVNTEGRGQPVPGATGVYRDPDAKLTSDKFMANPQLMGSLNKLIKLTPPGSPLPPTVQMVIKTVEANDKEAADIRKIQDQYKVDDAHQAGEIVRRKAMFKAATGQDPDERTMRDIVDSALGIKTRLGANLQYGEITLKDGTKVQGGVDPRNPGDAYDLAGRPIDATTIAKFTPTTKEPPLSATVRDAKWAADVQAHPENYSAQDKQVADRVATDAAKKSENLNLTVEQKKKRLDQLQEQMKEAQQLSPEATKLSADLYLQTGQLPALGLSGAAAGVARVKILNEAGRMATESGDTAAAITAKRATLAASKTALTQVTRQAGLTGAFEKSATKSLDLALKRSNEVDRSGSTMLNRWVQWKNGQISSDPAILRFQADVETATNEYAKVVTGQTGGAAVSDAARAQTGKMLSAAYSQEAFAAIVSDMKLDMANRITGYGEQQNELRDIIKGGGEEPRTATPPGGTPDVRNMSTEELLRMAAGAR